MSELEMKVKKSIERIKAFEPEDGYYLAFSGGKDSVVCKALLEMSGCKYDATYRVTSVDPPELVRFIKNQHPGVKRQVPRYSQTIMFEPLRGKPITMWNLIPMKLLPPTRVVRYCCHALKENGGDGRLVVTGVRWEESPSRKNNQGAVTVMDRTAAKKLRIVHFSKPQNTGDWSRTTTTRTRGSLWSSATSTTGQPSTQLLTGLHQMFGRLLNRTGFLIAAYMTLGSKESAALGARLRQQKNGSWSF